jgi:predicted DNA-binding protein (UPF0251 family)
VDSVLDPTTTSLRQLLATDAFLDSYLVSGAEGLDRIVEDVDVFNSFHVESEISSMENHLLIFDASSLTTDTYQVDVALRAASDGKASGIILVSPAMRIGLPATRLADKLQMPLITISQVEALRLADDVRRIVRLPFLVRSDAILQALTQLRKIPRGGSIDDALRVLANVLQGSTALLGADGTVVSSSSPKDFESPLKLPILEVPTSEHDGDFVYFAQPLSLAPREKSTLWLALRLKSPSSSRSSTASEILAVASWFIATILVADRLERERDARFRLGILNAITATKDRVEPALTEHLGVLGWQVEGWCTAFHLQVSGEVDPQRILNGSDELSRALQAVGVKGPIIERPDGWSGWFVEKDEPQSKSYALIVENLSSALTRLIPTSPGIRLHMGIGRPYQGVLGLRTSLAESKEACTIAQASGQASAVQHIDEMGVRRILLGWYASDNFAEFAQTLLANAIEADHDGELILTLESYLDNQSSPTETAAKLGIHRNTVLNRIEKIRSLLTVNLDDPDERLAVQLACRVVKLKRS